MWGISIDFPINLTLIRWLFLSSFILDCVAGNCVADFPSFLFISLREFGEIFFLPSFCQFQSSLLPFNPISVWMGGGRDGLPPNLNIHELCLLDLGASNLTPSKPNKVQIKVARIDFVPSARLIPLALIYGSLIIYFALKGAHAGPVWTMQGVILIYGSRNWINFPYLSGMDGAHLEYKLGLSHLTLRSRGFVGRRGENGFSRQKWIGAVEIFMPINNLIT